MKKKLDRELGLLAVCAVACGAMLSGLFVLPGHAALITGPSVYLAFLLAGALFVPAALSKAEMATALPEAGGDYIFIDRALGPMASTITGMGTWLSLMFKSAFALVGLSAYLALITPIPPAYLQYVAVLIGALLILVNCLGVKKTGQLQTVLVLASLLVLVFLVERGAIEVQREFYRPLFSKGWLGFASALAFVFVSYAGVTKIASAAEEVINPETNIPWGMLLPLTIMTFLYTAVAFVIVGVVPPDQLGKGLYKNAPVAQAALEIAGFWGEALMAVVAVMALAAMANAGILASSRYPFAMARYDQLPEAFSRTHPRFNTPMLAVILTGGSVLTSILLLPVAQIAKLASAFLLLVFALVNASLIVFREGEIEWYQPDFTSPMYPYVQIVGMVSSLILVGFMGWGTIAASLVLIAVGFLWYGIYVRPRVDRIGVLSRSGTEGKDPLREELGVFARARTQNQPEKRSVIVPFFEVNREELIRVERRVRLGAALCDREERLDVVHFVEAPEQSLLSEYEPDPELETEIEERVRLLRQDLEVDLTYDLVVTHRSRAALRSYAQQERPHWVVFDWQQPSPWQILIGARRWWLEDFPCDRLFFDDRDRPEWKQILVWTQPGPFDGEVVYAADQLAQHEAGEITFLHPAFPGEKEPSTAVETYRRKLENFCESPVRHRSIPVDRWVENVVEAGEQADLLLVGGLEHVAFPDVHAEDLRDEITERISCSLGRVESTLENPRSILDRDRFTGEETNKHFEDAVALTRLSTGSKESLFQQLADLLAEGDESASDVEEAFWERERIQNTYLVGGLAFPHAVCDALPETRYKIVVLNQPVEYTDDGRDVRLVVAVAGPPEDRQKHLTTIGTVSALLCQDSYRLDRDPPALEKHVRERLGLPEEPNVSDLTT